MFSHEISPTLFLNAVKTPVRAVAKAVPQATNHVVVVDCSGSMYHDLPQLRDHLKARLPALLAEGDTISIIWFSGRGESGVLVKGEPVATIKDLGDLNKAIDRWLKPVGLTGFKEPIELAAKVASELGGVCSLFFMSDGYDNQWSKAEIVKAAKSLTDKFAATTWVEYGYYANHPLLVELAETTGGVAILSENFKSYEPSFEAAMQKRPLGAKRIEVEIPGDPIKGVAFALDEGSILSFRVEDGKVQVPEHIASVWYLTPNKVSGDLLAEDPSAIYAAMAVYSQRVASDVVFALLKHTGDVRFIKQFSGCFGKQKYAEFVDSVTKAAFDPSLQLVEGRDPSAIPDDNAFTVLHLLKTLSEDDGNYVLLDSKDFIYSRIGRGTEETVELTEDEQKEVDALTLQLESASDSKTSAAIQKQLDEILLPKQPLKFKADPIPNGVEIRNLVYNEDRPNVSISVRRTGTVDLKARKAKQFKNIPDVFPTFIFRNYTIIRDGIVNVDRLPVRLTKATAQKLLDAGMPLESIQAPTGETRETTLTRFKKAGSDREINVVFDLRALPVINRAMVQDVSAKDLFETTYALTQARAAQKVFNTIKKDRFGGKTSEGYKVLYGEEGAAWLQEQGLTDYSGFNPGGKTKATTDVYVGKELKISLKGLSTIPSVNDYKNRVASGKALTASQSLLKPAMDAISTFEGSDLLKTAKDPDKVFEAWLESEQEALRKIVRDRLFRTSQIGFSVVVGQTWFSEFGSLDENSLDIQVGSETIRGTVEMREISVPL